MWGEVAMFMKGESAIEQMFDEHFEAIAIHRGVEGESD